MNSKNKNKNKNKNSNQNINKNINEKLINIFSRLADAIRIQRAKNWEFKVRSYQNFVRFLKKLKKPITSGKQAKEELNKYGFNLTPKAQQKIDIILELGYYPPLEEILQDQDVEAYLSLMKIQGVGAVFAKKMIDDYGIFSISQLRNTVQKDPNLLTSHQKVGLKYYEPLITPIPHQEIIGIEKLLKGLMKKLSKNRVQLQIVGSYRRKKPFSNDLDALISAKNPKVEKQMQQEGFKILDEFLDYLKKRGILVDQLSKGSTKFMGIIKNPDTRKIHKIDIRYIPVEDWTTALLYFTGSRNHNLKMRRQAIKMRYKLSEYGLIDYKGKKIPIKTEREVFDLLGMKYKSPRERI